MAIIYGVTSTKGGVGKTTNCASTGGILADMGLKVLLVDSDPMQSLSQIYEITNRAKHGLTQLMTTANPTDCISQTNIANLDIVISDDVQAEKGGVIQHFLTQSTSHYLFLASALKRVANDYDVILIDTRGALGYMQEAVVLAADELITPVQPTVLDIRECFSGTLPALQRLLPPQGMTLGNGRKELPRVSILINRNEATNISREIVNDLRSQFPTEKNVGGLTVRVLQTAIPKRTLLQSDALNHRKSGNGIPPHRLERRRQNGPSLLEIYSSLANELIPATVGMEPNWD